MDRDALELVADRFVRLGRRTIDLATGKDVWLRVEEAPPDGGWSERCAALLSRRLSAPADLLDYGPIGRTSRFQAFAPRRADRLRWRGRAGGVRQAIDRSMSAGDPLSAHWPPLSGSIWAMVEPIIEFLEAPCPPGARSLRIPPPGRHVRTLVLRLVAREARVRGFIPLNLALVDDDGDRGPGECCQRLVGTLADRVVLLLGDEEGKPTRATTAADAVLALGAVRARVAVLTVCGRTGPPMPATPDRPAVYQRPVDPLPLARERAPEFSGPPPASFRPRLTLPPTDTDGWRRLARGRDLAARGRHAAAGRIFREALGMYDRREDPLRAGTARYELGRLLAVRGVADESADMFEEAGRLFRRAGATRSAIAAAAREAGARMEAGRLQAAETLLRAADLAAEQATAGPERVMVRAVLVECLDWQNRTDDAQRIIEQDRAFGEWTRPGTIEVETPACRAGAWSDGPVPPCETESAYRLRWHCAAGAIALRRRSLEDAASQLAAALAAVADGSPLATCAAEILAIRFHALTGDLEALRLHVARGMVAARAARAPLEALRVRVRAAAAFATIGANAEAQALAARLARRRLGRIPALLEAEIGLVVGRILPASPALHDREAAASAFARACGALALHTARAAPGAFPAPVGDILDLLQRTHEYDDEDALLADVAQLLRERLAAVRVTFVSAGDPEAPLVSAGAGRSAGAARAVEAGTVLGPLRTSAGVEIAAPVRCGGATIGGLCVRWTMSGPDHSEHARTLVMTAATLAGPFLKAILDRRGAEPPGAECAELLGVSPAVQELRRTIARAAAAPFPVLIVGESGVGKELVAKAIHRGSPRGRRAFAALNCAALADDLAESELFGHARGAFTGAVAERRGLFEEADGGTLFLDEVSELSPRAQAKLLRVLQEGEVRRVGESFVRHVEVRVVSATNRSLDGPDGERVFRRDLRYRLDVIRIDVPPLRDRVEDVGVLASAFWTRVAPLTACRARLSAATLASLARYEWPGNVRELQNTMAALAVTAPRQGVVGPALLPVAIARAAPAPGRRLADARCAFERRLVAAALARAGGRPGRAAAELGVTRQGLAKLIRRLGIETPAAYPCEGAVG